MPRKLLIIDDDRDLRRIVKIYFTRKGWEVEEASTGQAGVERARALLPDAILLDFNLPDGNGPDFCRTIKAEEKLRRVPVLMISGYRKELVDRVMGLDLGAVDYIVKPFALPALAAKLEALVR